MFAIEADTTHVFITQKVLIFTLLQISIPYGLGVPAVVIRVLEYLEKPRQPIQNLFACKDEDSSKIVLYAARRPHPRGDFNAGLGSMRSGAEADGMYSPSQNQLSVSVTVPPLRDRGGEATFPDSLGFLTTTTVAPDAASDPAAQTRIARRADDRQVLRRRLCAVRRCHGRELCALR